MPYVPVTVPKAGKETFLYRDWFTKLRSLRLVSLGWQLMHQRWRHSQAFLGVNRVTLHSKAPPIEDRNVTEY